MRGHLPNSAFLQVRMPSAHAVFVDATQQPMCLVMTAYDLFAQRGQTRTLGTGVGSDLVEGLLLVQIEPRHIDAYGYADLTIERLGGTQPLATLFQLTKFIGQIESHPHRDIQGLISDRLDQIVERPFTVGLGDQLTMSITRQQDANPNISQIKLFTKSGG